jgi:hypothetical protein
MVVEEEREALARAASNVRWWPAALAFIVLGVAYALMSERLTVGPTWGLLVVVTITALGASLLRWRGLIAATRGLAMGGLVIVTAAVTVSAVYLVGALLYRSLESLALLRDAALLWTSNVLTFALWYWETDGGGPARRHARLSGSTDFAFPQRVLGDSEDAAWMPDFVDYVFLAFNTSTAFSPTDTMVLARRAKMLMMYQSIISLVTIAVLAARAINTL